MPQMTNQACDCWGRESKAQGGLAEPAKKGPLLPVGLCFFLVVIVRTLGT